jgi:hypothetical protein
MNPIVKVVTEIIIFLNRFMDSLNRKTIDTIKQIYYLLVFIIVAVGIFIGYNNGKGAAKEYGDPIAKYTDDVFDVIVKEDRENVRFSSLLEGKSIREKEESLLKKQAFPSNEKLEFESNHNIIEPDSDAKKISGEPRSDDRERIADIKRLDEIEPREDIKKLERKPPVNVDDNKSDVIKRGSDDLSTINKLENRESSDPSIRKSGPITRENKELLPIDKNSRIIEK